MRRSRQASSGGSVRNSCRQLVRCSRSSRAKPRWCRTICVRASTGSSAPLAIEVISSSWRSMMRSNTLTGTGSACCAGGDSHQLLEDTRGELTEVERRDRLARLHRISWLLHTMEKPTIAAVNGPAVAAGLSLALACDFRVMSATATLGSAFARLGVPGDFGGTWFAVRLLGLARAKELYLLDAPIRAAEALRLGLVTSVAAPEEFTVAVGALAERLARGPAGAFGLMKANFAAALSTPLEA